MITLESEKNLKCLTNSLKGNPPDVFREELIDFRQMEVKFICLGFGLEDKCLYKDLTSKGHCRMQVEHAGYFECLRRI